VTKTFIDLIQQNKRQSWLLTALFVLFIAALGAIFGYVYGYYYLGGDVVSGLIWSIGLALLMGVVMALAAYYGGTSAILAVSGAKPIHKQDDPQLYNIVEELAIASGSPVPRIYLIDDTAPNAFATGRDPRHAVVAITTGLREKLNRDELQAVMAHEMSHVRNYDIRFAMLMAVMVGMVVLMCDAFRRMLWYGSFGGRRRRSSSRGGGGGGAIVLVLLIAAVILSIIAPILAKLIQLAVSRQREYLADASAVELTRHPQALASALAKISNDKEVLEVANRATQHLYIVNPIKQFEARAHSMFNTHPPIKDRIQRLLSLTQP